MLIVSIGSGRISLALCECGATGPLDACGAQAQRRRGAARQPHLQAHRQPRAIDDGGVFFFFFLKWAFLSFGAAIALKKMV